MLDPKMSELAEVHEEAGTPTALVAYVDEGNVIFIGGPVPW